MRWITGKITLKSGEEIEITDENLVANSLSIKMSTCQSKFDVGSFNAAIMTIGILDEQSLNHDFGSAVITLAAHYKADGESGTETADNLGIYYVNAEQTKRVKNKITLTAQDKTFLFDKEISATDKSAAVTPITAVQLACTRCGVNFADVTDTFPNSDVRCVLASESIQTYRDVVMWAAQLMACNAVIDRNGRLTLRRARYLQDNSVVTIDRTLTADERMSIKFSDSRVCVNTLNSYSAGKPKTYTVPVSSQDPTSVFGGINLPENPLMSGKSESDCDDINGAWVRYFGAFAPRNVTAKIFGGSDIWLGETIAFVGGDIDLSRRLVGVVTTINWKYGGQTTVTCVAPQEGGY